MSRQHLYQLAYAGVFHVSFYLEFLLTFGVGSYPIFYKLGPLCYEIIFQALLSLKLTNHITIWMVYHFYVSKKKLKSADSHIIPLHEAVFGTTSIAHTYKTQPMNLCLITTAGFTTVNRNVQMQSWWQYKFHALKWFIPSPSFPHTVLGSVFGRSALKAKLSFGQSGFRWLGLSSKAACSLGQLITSREARVWCSQVWRLSITIRQLQSLGHDMWDTWDKDDTVLLCFNGLSMSNCTFLHFLWIGYNLSHYYILKS